MLGFTGSPIVEDAALRITVERDQVGADETIADPEIRAAVAAVLEALGEAARRKAEEELAA